MKTSYLFIFATIFSILSLEGAEGLKLELIPPRQPVVLSKTQIAEIENVSRAKESLQAVQQGEKPDLETLRRWENIVMDALRAEQGIELSYRITNHTDTPITLEHGGDATTNTFKTTGPGAIDLPYRGMMTLEFRMGKPLTIEAGASKEFTIKELKYGMRDMSRWLISKGGDYQIMLTQRTKADGKLVELISNTIKLKVEAN